jgi:phage tail sheath gpL-like
VTIIIQGFSATDKVPGAVGQTIYGAGGISVGAILTLLICAQKRTGYTAGLAPDVDVVDIGSDDDGDAYWGPGSEGARMAHQTIGVPGVRVKGCAPAAAVGASAATATITIDGSPSETGSWSYRIAGETITAGINTGDTPGSIAAAIKSAVQSRPRMAASADVAGGVVTLTWKSAGVRGNDGTLFQDISDLPAGISSVLSGGVTLLSSKGGEKGVRFSGGAGVEDLTNMLAVLFPARYGRIAAAQNDPVSAARWKAQMDGKADPLEGREEQLCFGHGGLLSAAQSLARTTLNNWRMQVGWLLNSEAHPSEIAARIAAGRTQLEQDNANAGFDGYVLTGIAPQASRADWAQRVTQQAALDQGVTPLVTDEQGNVTIVRSITSHCLNGADPDYRTLDTAQSVVPDFVRDDLRVFWTTSFVVANPYVRDNPSPVEQDPPHGVATPNSWNAAVESRLLDHQANMLITEVEENPPVSEFNKTATRIMSAVTAIPLPLQHQIGVSVRQKNV